jgi:hypothetical protein
MLLYTPSDSQIDISQNINIFSFVRWIFKTYHMGLALIIFSKENVEFF